MAVIGPYKAKNGTLGVANKNARRILSLPAPTPPKHSKSKKQIHTNGFHRVDTFLGQFFSLLFAPPNRPFLPYFFSNPPVTSHPDMLNLDISSISLFFDPKQPQKYGFITYGLLRVPEKKRKKKKFNCRLGFAYYG